MTNANTKLNASTVAGLSSQVKKPAYDWKNTKVGILHISLGAFHRAHQAVYTDSLLALDGGDWGICGVGAMQGDKTLLDNLKAADHLYSVFSRDASSKESRVVGSLRETMLMPENPAAVVARLMDPAIKILSMTITEKGYCHDPQTGLLNPEHPMIRHDLTNLDKPQSGIGLIVAGLKGRMDRGMKPFTVLSCDNLPGNGHKTKTIVTAFAKLVDEKLAAWIESNVAFPNTMVDRITPVTLDSDKQTSAETFGFQDDALVVCETFTQWVLEDKFTDGRPAWEKVGAQFVQDVYPYELAKIRLLNVSHTVFAYPAYMMNYEWVSDGASDPLLARYVRHVMDVEITPTLPPVPGMELEPYKTTIIQRFANPAIKDTWERICSDGSQKIANQLVPIILERHAKGQSADGLTILLASWFRYLTAKHDDGRSFALNDPMADQLQKIATAAGRDPRPLLALKEIFGDLGSNEAFVKKVEGYLNAIYDRGIGAVLAEHYPG